MAETGYRIPDNVALTRAGTPWGAIWAGVFSFGAIWMVFGMLGAAIFRPTTGLGWGIGIWSIILTMIAMYVGGRVTAHLAQVQTRGEGILYGMAMFGLAVVSTLVLLALNGATGSASMGAATPYLSTVIASVGWFGWLALFLGWLCALGGASTVTSFAVQERQAAEVRDFRSAA
jgi:hypothetical protein